MGPRASAGHDVCVRAMRVTGTGEAEACERVGGSRVRNCCGLESAAKGRRRILNDFCAKSFD